MPERVNLLGFDFLVTRDVDEVAELLMADLGRIDAGLHFVVTPNAAQTVYYHETRREELLRFFKGSRYVLPDGMPLVWLGRRQAPAMQRLTGSDLFPALWKRIKTAGLNAVFVLPSEDLASQLAAEHPGCRMIVPPFFDAADIAYVDSLADEVNAAAAAIDARFVFLGIGFPKQEMLAMRMSQRLVEPLSYPRIALLLGASFEFYFGVKSRAPRWMQKNGLEWLHRLTSEPRRMWKRYTVDNLRFAGLALQELLKKRDKSAQ